MLQADIDAYFRGLELDRSQRRLTQAILEERFADMLAAHKVTNADDAVVVIVFCALSDWEPQDVTEAQIMAQILPFLMYCTRWRQGAPEEQRATATAQDVTTWLITELKKLKMYTQVGQCARLATKVGAVSLIAGVALSAMGVPMGTGLVKAGAVTLIGGVTADQFIKNRDIVIFTAKQGLSKIKGCTQADHQAMQARLKQIHSKLQGAKS